MAATEVVEGLANLFFAVHHEGALANDGLINGLTAEHQQSGVGTAFDFNAAALLIELDELRFAHHISTVHQNHAAQHDDRRRAPRRKIKTGEAALNQANVPYVHGAEGMRRSLPAAVLARDDTDSARLVGERNRGNVAVKQSLVARLSQFRARRKVDPELDHFERAAFPGERLGVEFFVQDAGGSGHPLHVAGANMASCASRIAMVDLALIDDGHGFETPMRVNAHATSFRCWGELRGPGVVEQQERAEVRAVALVREHGANRKSVPYPMRPGGTVDTSDLLHAHLVAPGTMAPCVERSVKLAPKIR
ncbi:hypothetical protein D3C87_1261620 [compost metagenome]